MLLVQPALATDAKTAEAKTDAAEAAAAMERAKRLAANPLRVILEASKVRRRVVAEPDATPSSPTAPATPGAALVLNAPSTSVLAARGDETPQPVPVRQSPMRTLTVAPIATSMAGQVPAMVATDRLTAPETIAPAAFPPSGAAMAATPRLIEMIEPAIPVRVLDELGRAVEFTADLTIRPDGTVALVQVVPPVNRTLSRYVVAAMERWRFAPLPIEQLHRVQLVFNNQ